ncbi:MAG: Holliday junction resolvase RuvX [Syntrophomonadaceae bacterium]|jgi:putative Holliday junction resolvase|nr:Holliday junction resolvase RuvX [Syntrophomonadaceae bacterium]
MRFIALDVGTRRIGIAVSDPSGLIAQVHSVWLRKSPHNDYAHIAGVCSGYEDLQSVVVGLPLNMNGTVGEKALEIMAFIEKLKPFLDCPVVTWDERMTTVSAEQLLISANVTRKKRRQIVDKVAAVYILQSYLDRINN